MVKSIYQGTSQINQGTGLGRPGYRYATETIGMQQQAEYRDFKILFNIEQTYSKQGSIVYVPNLPTYI